MNTSSTSRLSKKLVLADTRDKGLLIVFEGTDGSGKTTQHKLLKSWLRSQFEDVVVTKWNSSSVFKPLIKARKAARSLDPWTFAILHAADFWHRFETIMQPALSAGKIVLADRYVFTGLARDVARGMDRDWCAQLYASARKPDLVFYFDAPVNVCASRIEASRDFKFYEAGQDVTGMTNGRQSYLRFTPSVVAEYKWLQDQFGFVTVDAELPVYEQHRFIRETYLDRFSRWARETRVEPQLSAFLSEVDV
jgi:dTMP kinase